MSDFQDQADELRRRMEQVRTDLDQDVECVVENAKTLADWKYYVKSFPWAALAASTALGFLAVPKKLVVFSPDAKSLEKLAKQNRLVVTSEPKNVAEQRGVTATLLTFAGTLALRGAMELLKGRIGEAFRQSAAQREPSLEDAPPPPTRITPRSSGAPR